MCSVFYKLIDFESVRYRNDSGNGGGYGYGGGGGGGAITVDEANSHALLVSDTLLSPHAPADPHTWVAFKDVTKCTWQKRTDSPSYAVLWFVRVTNVSQYRFAAILAPTHMPAGRSRQLDVIIYTTLPPALRKVRSGREALISSGDRIGL
jgi:hypothetical protein